MVCVLTWRRLGKECRSLKPLYTYKKIKNIFLKFDHSFKESVKSFLPKNAIQKHINQGAYKHVRATWSTFLKTRLSGYLSIVSLSTTHLLQSYTWPTYDTKWSQQLLFSRLWSFQLDFLKFTSAREKTWASLYPSFPACHYHSHPLTTI